MHLIRLRLPSCRLNVGMIILKCKDSKFSVRRDNVVSMACMGSVDGRLCAYTVEKNLVVYSSSRTHSILPSWISILFSILSHNLGRSSGHYR